MRHTSLKTEIQIQQATTRIQRASATKLIRQGRDLRKQAAAEPDTAKQARMAAQGWVCRTDSMDLRAKANDGRSSRRVMHLAAALLNGKTYLQCEKTAESKPDAQSIASWIKPHLLPEEQPHAEFIAETWLSTGEIRLREIREQGLVERLGLDKAQAVIDKLKVEIKRTEQSHSYYQGIEQQHERSLVQARATTIKWRATLSDLQWKCLELEADLTAQKEALAASKAVTRSIDDLFEDVV